ncbi:hypothetical protein I6A84_06960 [Frankia sp. CNm7]|uniref:Glucosyl-3-phosphoglycerate synthase n=1 Tax=Frankia nepalensis TaxID=1836974 RepID=A0A937UVC2_9ACTN|nr:hypothetical protein [Frankia nepalensis]MBL7499910.1 hypothetical protein [Frankia nepalensis]MBL7515418.1 hypothetical protein [Frankia nepalensis]MBL7517870.1 hypothetical protein [Frankia nepalensis]MBL7633105.1 hypothetical protein [Frankia nepalensis]
MHTLDPTTLDLDALEEDRLAKGITLSVLIPARGPESASTLGNMIARIRDRWMRDRHVLDEIGVVVDPTSDGDEHGLVEIAEEAGASWAVRGESVLALHAGPEAPAFGGKAGAMRSLAFLAFGDRLIFHDSDLENYDPMTAGRLAAAMTADEGLMFVNGSSPRLTGSGQPGGRTTEMLRSLYAKQLGGYVPAITRTIQPLIGEFALDADVFAALAFSRGYGVETSVKVLALDMLAPEECAQVELPIKYQVGQHYHDLVKQFHEISFTVDLLEAYFQRRRVDPRITIWELAQDYGLLFPGRQFALCRPPGYDQVDFVPRLGFYPPLASSPAYRARLPEIKAARRAALDALGRKMRTSA